MNVYLDSSVVLGRLQGERAPTIPWARWEHAYSSVLLRAEVLRTIDRSSRLRQALTDQNVAELIGRAHAVFDTIELVRMSQPNPRSSIPVVSHCPWHTGRLASGNRVAFTRDRRNRNDIPDP